MARPHTRHGHTQEGITKKDTLLAFGKKKIGRLRRPHRRLSKERYLSAEKNRRLRQTSHKRKTSVSRKKIRGCAAHTDICQYPSLLSSNLFGGLGVVGRSGGVEELLRGRQGAWVGGAGTVCLLVPCVHVVNCRQGALDCWWATTTFPPEPCGFLFYRQWRCACRTTIRGLSPFKCHIADSDSDVGLSENLTVQMQG